MSKRYSSSSGERPRKDPELSPVLLAAVGERWAGVSVVEQKELPRFVQPTGDGLRGSDSPGGPFKKIV